MSNKTTVMNPNLNHTKQNIVDMFNSNVKGNKYI